MRVYFKIKSSGEEGRESQETLNAKYDNYVKNLKKDKVKFTEKEGNHKRFGKCKILEINE